LKTLTAKVARTVFIPLSYQVRGTNSSFFVDDYKAAEKLASANKKITTTEGFQLLGKREARITACGDRYYCEGENKGGDGKALQR
jgi:hypothetical protein